MKLSNYIEFSEPFGKKSYRILFSTKTAKKLLIDKITYDNLINKEFMKLSNENYKNLYNEGILVDDDINELKDFLQKSEKYIENNSTLYEVIQPSADCQLGCAYCGQTHQKKNINSDLIAKIANRIENKLKTKKYTHLSVGWFGGEPLLAISKIEELTEKLKNITNKYNISYSSSITTNGIGLKEAIFRRLLSCQVKEIDITLDGYMRIHDERRPIKKSIKISSYEIITKNLIAITHTKEFTDSNVKLIIRTNVDENNYKNIVNLVEDLTKKGLREKIHSFYLAPIHSWGNDAHKEALNNKSFGELEIKFMIYLLKNKFKVGILPNNPKQQVCMSLSRQSEVYDALGNVFNCTEIPYVKTYENTNFYIDNLNEKFSVKERSFKDWYKEIEKGSFPCTQCKILPICGGACPKAWYEGNPPCPSIKYNLKDRLLLFAKQTFNT